MPISPIVSEQKTMNKATKISKHYRKWSVCVYSRSPWLPSAESTYLALQSQ